MLGGQRSTGNDNPHRTGKIARHLISANVFCFRSQSRYLGTMRPAGGTGAAADRYRRRLLAATGLTSSALSSNTTITIKARCAPLIPCVCVSSLIVFSWKTLRQTP